MELTAAKIKNLAIQIAAILVLVIGVVAVATQGVSTKLPSLF
jgi:hypothetical protein